MVRGVVGNQVINIFFLIGFKYEVALLIDYFVFEFYGYVVVVGVYGDGFDFRIQEFVYDYFVFGSYKFEVVYVDGQENVVRVGLYVFVLDLEYGIVVQWELFDIGQVLYYGFQFVFVFIVML